MSDLISRQMAIDAFLAELTRREEKNLLHTWSTVEVEYYISKILEQLPTVDAVPVVRCKDCTYAHITNGGTCKYCDSWSEVGEVYLDGDFYCAFGERREDVSDTDVGKTEEVKHEI